jgi:hypothetical protein
MYFLDTPVSDELMAAAESHRFNIARTQILLCCDDAQPGLTGVMTEDEALQHVLSNVSEWEEELPETEGLPPSPTGEQ